MPRLNPGGMDIMDGVGHTVTTGVNNYWSGWIDDVGNIDRGIH